MSDSGADVTRSSRRRVDGVLLLDKPSGISSNTALQRARRALRAAKAGHTGTLDPLASGLLPVCFGEATKFARFLLDADKRYRATVRFGVATTTQDAEGEVVSTSQVDFDRASLDATLARFCGTITQVPPAHSALRIEGRRAYEYARAGIEVERRSREVHIRSLALIAWAPPDATLDVRCSKGTYIRALAADLGAALGGCAHLTRLRREATGGFAIAGAIALDRLEALPESERMACLLPVDTLVETLSRVDVDEFTARALRSGSAVSAGVIDASAIETRASGAGAIEVGGEILFRVYAPGGSFIGVARHVAHTLTPVRMTSTVVAAYE